MSFRHPKETTKAIRLVGHPSLDRKGERVIRRTKEKLKNRGDAMVVVVAVVVVVV